MVAESSDVLGWAAPSVSWEAQTAATRYLCAAAHLRRPMLPRTVRDGEEAAERDPHPVGRAFARHVIRGPGIIAPCPGVDTAWVIRHAHASWTQAAIRDLAAAGGLVACGYYFPAGTILWLGLALCAIVLSAAWKRIPRKRRRLAALAEAAVIAVAAGAMLRGGHEERSLQMPWLWLAFCFLVFLLDAFAVWIRLRRLSKLLSRPPRPPFPLGPLSGDLQAAARLHERNVVFYERGRIVGAGTPSYESTLTTPIDEAQSERRVQRFTASELFDFIASHIRRQGEAGDSTFGLPRLTVGPVLARPIAASKKSPSAVPDAQIRSAADQGTAGTADRAYVVARATTWDGELTGSIYVSVALEGRYLRLTVLPYVIAPVVDELRAIDAIAARGPVRQLLMSTLSAVSEIRMIVAAVRTRTRARLERGARPGQGATPLAKTRSLREAYAKERTDDLHQRHDGSRIIQVMEQRVFTVVETFLDEHGIATARFRAQADQVISTYITVSGSNNNIATGAGSNAGNGTGSSPMSAHQGAGA